MKVKISPSQIAGTVSAPPSKSYTHRAIIIAALADGVSLIKNPLMSVDTVCTIDACKKLGAPIDLKNNNLVISGVGSNFPKTKSPIHIFCGLSGTTMRLITAVSGLSNNKIIIDGEKRLRERPMKDLLAALNKSGIKVKSINNDDLLPVCVNGGELKGGIITLSGNISSQFVSALLLISPFAKKDTMIEVKNLRSKPYVDITVDLMKTFGVKVKVDGEKYFIKSGQHYKGQEYTVEGDYSSASYFFAAAVVTGSKITVNNLNSRSVQGDKYFLKILKQMGSDVILNEDRITVTGKNLRGVSISMKDCPDIVPSVAAAAAYADGKTAIINIGNLRVKETDRIAAIVSELNKMGIKSNATYESLNITGGNPVGNNINTYNDHRMAMSFAVLGLAAKGETIIKDSEVVTKSYPNFWEDFKKIGAQISYL